MKRAVVLRDAKLLEAVSPGRSASLEAGLRTCGDDAFDRSFDERVRADVFKLYRRVFAREDDEQLVNKRLSDFFDSFEIESYLTEFQKIRRVDFFLWNRNCRVR